MDQLVWILLIIFLSCFIQAFTGFGSALVSVPLLLSFMPLEQVVPLVAASCNSTVKVTTNLERGFYTWRYGYPRSTIWYLPR